MIYSDYFNSADTIQTFEFHCPRCGCKVRMVKPKELHSMQEEVDYYKKVIHNLERQINALVNKATL